MLLLVKQENYLIDRVRSKKMIVEITEFWWKWRTIAGSPCKNNIINLKRSEIKSLKYKTIIKREELLTEETENLFSLLLLPHHRHYYQLLLLFIPSFSSFSSFFVNYEVQQRLFRSSRTTVSDQLDDVIVVTFWILILIKSFMLCHKSQYSLISSFRIRTNLVFSPVPLNWVILLISIVRIVFISSVLILYVYFSISVIRLILYSYTLFKINSLCRYLFFI